MTQAALLLEFTIIFLLLPLAYVFAPVQLPPLPLLWTVALYTYVVSRRNPHFGRATRWNPHIAPDQIVSILAIFLPVGGLIVLGVWRFAPRLLFTLVRVHPVLWAIIMLLYPILSVFPQGLIYRVFLMHRYAPLVSRLQKSTQEVLLILASAAAFGWMHIVFRNPLAVAMTFFGGLLFAWRYQKTDSQAASSFEHALYGCLLFTAGIGQYFYLGRVRIH